MTAPNVQLTKVDGRVGISPPATEGVFVFIGTSSSGTTYQPTVVARKGAGSSVFGIGPLVEAGEYQVQHAKRQAIMIRVPATTPGSYGAVTLTGTGTSVPTAGASTPIDEYEFAIEVLKGGTLGVDGIEYRYSYDGGRNWSARQSLGVAMFIEPEAARGVRINLAAGSLVTGDQITTTTVAPAFTNTELTTALEALRTSGHRWTDVAVLTIATASNISVLDSWISAQQVVGKYKYGFMQMRRRNSGETRAAYMTAMATLYASVSNLNVSLCVDACYLTSSVDGKELIRPALLAVCARIGLVDIAVDAARVSDGALPAVTILDTNNSPVFHDETQFPGFDDLRFIALCTIPGQEGTYIANPKALVPSGSDFVYVQHSRVLNKAAETIFRVLTRRLSSEVLADRTSGYILETEAQDIEALGNDALRDDILKPRRASAAFLDIGRTDNILQTSTVTYDVGVQFLGYTKYFKGTIGGVKTAA